MLVNLTGGPCSGKSTLASEFINTHPEFTHLSIDNFRIKYIDEDESWYQLMISAATEQHSILETSGLSWHLDAHILNHPAVLKRGVLTIVLQGNNLDFLDRLEIRERTGTKQKIPFKYKNFSMQGLIKVCAEKLPVKYPTAYFMETGAESHQEATYKEFEKCILQRKKVIDEYLKIS